MILTPSAWLFTFLKGIERFRPTAYKPTKNDVWTIGFGHTEGVKEGDTCSYPQAIAWLEHDVRVRAVKAAPLIKVALTQAQADAILSLVFNIGVGVHDGRKGDFADSTLLAKLNAGDYAGAAAEFPKWKFQAGQVLNGLVERRKAEQAHFLGH